MLMVFFRYIHILKKSQILNITIKVIKNQMFALNWSAFDYTTDSGSVCWQMLA